MGFFQRPTFSHSRIRADLKPTAGPSCAAFNQQGAILSKVKFHTSVRVGEFPHPLPSLGHEELVYRSFSPGDLNAVKCDVSFCVTIFHWILCF